MVAKPAIDLSILKKNELVEVPNPTKDLSLFKKADPPIEEKSEAPKPAIDLGLFKKADPPV